MIISNVCVIVLTLSLLLNLVVILAYNVLLFKHQKNFRDYRKILIEHFKNLRPNIPWNDPDIYQKLKELKKDHNKEKTNEMV